MYLFSEIGHIWIYYYASTVLLYLTCVFVFVLKSQVNVVFVSVCLIIYKHKLDPNPVEANNFASAFFVSSQMLSIKNRNVLALLNLFHIDVFG